MAWGIEYANEFDDCEEKLNDSEQVTVIAKKLKEPELETTLKTMCSDFLLGEVRTSF